MAWEPGQPGRRLGSVSAGVALVLIAALALLSALVPPTAGGAERVGATPNATQTRLQAEAQRDPLAVELEARLADDVRPVLTKYCYDCHGNGQKKGGVKLDGPGDIESIMHMADDWLTVAEVINAGLMPPDDQPQPSAHEVQTIQQWVEEAADYYPADAEPDPGWYTIHRLNRSEYRNTLRDLLGIDPSVHDLAEHLPADDSGYGFDNIADVLSMSPLQLESYLDAAERAVDLALRQGSPDGVRLDKLERTNIGMELDGGGHGIWTNGSVRGERDFAEAGVYELVFTLQGDFADGVGPRVALTVDGETIKELDVTADRGDDPQAVTLEAELSRGKHKIGVRFLNDAIIKGKDRNLYVLSISIAGPIKEDTPVYEEVFFVQPTADDKGNRLPGAPDGSKRLTESQAARQVVERFASRAFRRPADKAEVAALTRLYRDARGAGDDYETAVRLALTATLVSPNFLYRAITNPKANDPEAIYELSDYELASRLSYFLWSSMPDNRLLELAAKKRLRDKRELKAQVRRMLMDPKADALVENFAGQWLLLRKLDGVAMDPQRYPEFDDGLREAMRAEAELFFADVLREDRSVLMFLDSEKTYLNQQLAEHYGVKGVEGEQFRAVTLPKDSPRGGVLTMAATLTVTSEATRTSPVKRGDYVLAQLLGTPPPPPPPDVPPLEQATEQLGEDATLREQLAAHVANPNCAVCHKRLDPIGLALENFTATGAWRDTERGRPIDAAAELPGGVRFDGPVELKQIMLDRRDLFVQNLSRKMLTYATGRGTEPFDRPTIQKIAQSVRDNNDRMQSLIEAVVLSDAFLKARGRETK